jgi:hypothetical protein
VGESDFQYFGRRASEERAAAERAVHASAARAHHELSQRYDDLARAIVESEQQMRIRVA